MPQAALVDLDAGPEQLRLRQLFHGKADRVSRTFEAAILHFARHLAITRRKQLRRGGEIELLHPKLQHRRISFGKRMNRPDMGMPKRNRQSGLWRPCRPAVRDQAAAFVSISSWASCSASSAAMSKR